MAQNKRISVIADSDARQIIRIPNDRPGSPFIHLQNVEIDLEGKKEKVDLNITLSTQLLRDITRDSIHALGLLVESARVEAD